MAADVVTSFISIGDLKLFEDVVDGMVVETTGYYNANDGGHGVYYYSANGQGIDNGGTVIKPSNTSIGGRWFLLFDTINIRQFGAQTGDPSQVSSSFWADNAARVQAAIDYCASHRIGLYVPAGIYPVSTLDLNPKRTGSGSPAQYKGGGRFALYGDGAATQKDMTGSGLLPKASVFWAQTDSAQQPVCPFSCHFSDDPTAELLIKEFQIRDITFIGNTPNYILDTAGSFKSQFRNVAIQNRNAAGKGWDLSNMDQLLVENILIISEDPNTSTKRSTGNGLVIQNSIIDGSLSTFTNVQVLGYDTGFLLGKAEASFEPSYQQYNTFECCITDKCRKGLFLARKWYTNRFISCRFSGIDSGARIGAAINNVFTGCTFEATSQSQATTGEGLYLGYGSSANEQMSSRNTFDKCLLQSASTAAPPMRWTVTAESTNDNVLSDCELVAASTSAGSYCIKFENAGPPDASGTVIRPKFNSATLFSSFPQYFTYVPVSKSWSGYTQVLTNDEGQGTYTTADIYKLAMDPGEVVTMYVTALGKDKTSNQRHIGIVRQAAFVRIGSNDVVALTSAYPPPISEQNKSGSTQSCYFDINGSSVVVKVTGEAGKKIQWACSVNLIRSA